MKNNLMNYLYSCITLDGAHSAVRQNLYRSLHGKNFLPKSDTEDLKFTQNAVMGMTNPLDLEVYPAVGARFTECHIIIGKESPYTVRVLSRFFLARQYHSILLFSNTHIHMLLV